MSVFAYQDLRIEYTVSCIVFALLCLTFSPSFLPIFEAQGRTSAAYQTRTPNANVISFGTGTPNLKFSTWNSRIRRSGSKRYGDMSGIMFIRELMVQSGQRINLRGPQGDLSQGLKA
jgi:hypothetical protein